jgi:hypothetical protein
MFNEVVDGALLTTSASGATVKALVKDTSKIRKIAATMDFMMTVRARFRARKVNLRSFMRNGCVSVIVAADDGDEHKRCRQ